MWGDFGAAAATRADEGRGGGGREVRQLVRADMGAVRGGIRGGAAGAVVWSEYRITLALSFSETSS